MKKPLQIGITGGIGSGKSLVCRIFQSLGVSVYDADSRAKELMITDGTLVNEIKTEFGQNAYFPDGKIDRGYLAKVAFGDTGRLNKLNQMVHPRVREDFRRWVEAAGEKPYVIKEAALIFESESYRDLNAIVVVTAPEAIRMKRIKERDPQRSETDIEDIFRNQMPEAEKLKRADHVIVNDETELVIPQVIKLHEHFVNRV